MSQSRFWVIGVLGGSPFYLSKEFDSYALADKWRDTLVDSEGKPIMADENDNVEYIIVEKTFPKNKHGSPYPWPHEGEDENNIVDEEETRL